MKQIPIDQLLLLPIKCYSNTVLIDPKPEIKSKKKQYHPESSHNDSPSEKYPKWLTAMQRNALQPFVI